MLFTVLGLLSLQGLIVASLYNQTPLLCPCMIQGGGFSSPFAGQSVRTRGVVYADLDETAKRGFFIQQENCDEDPWTSDGIFIYLGNRMDVVRLGDRVEVAGQVKEYYGLTEISTSPDLVTVLSNDTDLPEPIELNPPFKTDLAKQYFESLEGMYVGMDHANVVGPTNERDETWVINAELGVDRVFQHDLAGTGEVVCVDDGGLFEIKPEASVGDQTRNLHGVLDYSYGLYRMQLLAQPILISGNRVFQIANFSCGLSVATFNLGNLFDPIDAPEKRDPVPSGAEYLRHLSKIASAIHIALGEPTLIAAQEVENDMVLQDLLAREEIEAEYAFVWEEGLDERGIDVALLYRKDRAQVLTSEQRQGCTTVIDGLGPDGNGDVTNPHNTITCDTDADGVLDGNRLFSRPPLLIHLDIFPGSCFDGLDLWLIVNHWKSKGDDSDEIQYTLPRRIEQAAFIADLYREITRFFPNARVMVLGDLNDYPDSEPLKVLERSGLENLITFIPPDQQYTYIYRGISQVFDHLLINHTIKDQLIAVLPLHINADYAEVYSQSEANFLRCSDHDPVLAWFGVLDDKVFLPLILRK